MSTNETPAAEAPKPAAARKGGASQIFVDLGPVLIFMLTYNLAHRFVAAGQEIYVATGVFIVATLIAVAYAWFVQKRLPPMLIITAAVVCVFGGLTIWLHNDLFIKLKPTIINLLFAGAILGGLAMKQNVWKMMFQSAFPVLPERVWTIFALRWAAFYIFLAIVNEIVWRNFSQAFWVNFKLLGVVPMTFLFMLANIPLLMKHMPKDDAPKP